jgi:hypothetical protein
MPESDLTRDALANYTLDYTTALPSAWDIVPRTGLYPVTAVNADTADFLEVLHAYCENHPESNFLDGQEHTLPDALSALFPARGNSTFESALRFISLGVELGVFSLLPGTWDLATRMPETPVDRDSVDRWISQRIYRGELCGFRHDPTIPRR